MRKNCLIMLIMTCILTGCISTPPNNTPTTTPPSESAVEVRPGVYVTNGASALPLPTSGYDVYVIGEIHGIHESHILFLDYLKMLHEANGLRDIVLEAPQSYEGAMNEYVLGLTDTPLGRYCTEIERGVKAFNETLPNEEKIRVHAVELYRNPLSAIHTLRKEIGMPAGHIQIPSSDEFERWSEDEKLALVDQLAEAAGDDDSIVDRLEMVRASVRGFISSKIVKSQIREETTAQNIRYVLKELDGAPVLALYGGAHAQKRPTPTYGVRSWTQHLVESGINVYSVYTTGIRGESWDPYVSTGSITFSKNPDQIVFSDGTTLGDIFDGNPNYNIVYIDLRSEANKFVKTSGDLGGIVYLPSHTIVREIYDGLIIFREVTPTQIEMES